MNKRYRQETDVLEAAIDAVKQAAGLELRVLEREAAVGDMRVDAVLEAKGGRQPKLYVEVKRWAQHVERRALLHQLRRLPKPAVLVADYINPNMAETLRDEGILFFDTVGNAYLDLEDRLVFLVGQKAPAQRKPGARRAFNATGLKVIFALIRNEALLNAAYREIAKEADVALGTVGWVMRDLKEDGFLVERGPDRQRQRTFARRDELLQRWVENYLGRLRPKLLLGQFVAKDPKWWEGFDIEKVGAVWAGEVAGDKLVHVTRPKVETVFVEKENLAQLIQRARLRTFVGREGDEPEGLVMVYEPFWPMDPDEDMAHPLVVYANLIAMGNPRVNEAAEKVYEQFLA